MTKLKRIGYFKLCLRALIPPRRGAISKGGRSRCVLQLYARPSNKFRPVMLHEYLVIVEATMRPPGGKWGNTYCSAVPNFARDAQGTVSTKVYSSVKTETVILIPMWDQGDSNNKDLLVLMFSLWQLIAGQGAVIAAARDGFCEKSMRISKARWIVYDGWSKCMAGGIDSAGRLPQDAAGAVCGLVGTGVRRLTGQVAAHHGRQPTGCRLRLGR